jgi:branched-chain amino acid transport system ATP-binding protein
MMLEIKGLASHYGRIQAIKDVNVSIAEGELVALVGANGAGKTTLLRAISGVQPVTEGQVVFEGADITKMAAEKRVGLGIAQVPEGRQVFGPLSVEDNLRLGAYRRKGKDVPGDIERVYTQFPILKQKRKQPAGTLSGGQQQMLAMGRALMSHPRLLLLDEPSMGLSPILVEEIFSTVTLLKSQGTTIFLIEQNAMAALSIADRGYVLETGSVVLSGSGKELLANDRVKEAYLGM